MAPDSDQADQRAFDQLYLLLAGLFIAALVTCNLIFLKFFTWDIPLPGGGHYNFQQSVGILPYPVTFLVTDILSEIYGRRRANQVVTAGLFASVFMVGIVLVAQAASASPTSQVDDATFKLVFGLQWQAVTASMIAYLSAQYLDIRLFHFWRRRTRGRHLWLRNNASTINSQVVDTAAVLTILAVLEGAEGPVPWERWPALFVNGVLFKMAVALLDTPLLYLGVALLRRRFPNQVLPMDETRAEAGAA